MISSANNSLHLKDPHSPLPPVLSQAYPARAAAGGVSHPPQHQPQRRRLLPEQPDYSHQGRSQQQARQEVSVTLLFLFREQMRRFKGLSNYRRNIKGQFW